jgi:outer membrane protein TolC
MQEASDISEFGIRKTDEFFSAFVSKYYKLVRTAQISAFVQAYPNRGTGVEVQTLKFNIETILRFRLISILIFIKSMCKKYFVAVMLSVLVAASSVEAQTKRLTLADAVTLALEQNRDLKVARLDVGKSDQKVREAWSAVLPQLSASGQYTRNFQSQVLFLPGSIIKSPLPIVVLRAGGDNAFTGSLSLSQTLFQGATFAAIRSAKLADALSAETFNGSKANIIADVRKAYYNVLILAELLKLNEQSLSRSADALTDQRNLFKQGLVADVDTLRSYIAVENLRPGLIKSANAVEVAKTILKTKMGISQTEVIELADSLAYDSLLFSENEEADYAEAVASRPDVKQLGISVKVSDAAIDGEFAGHLPTLSAFGTLGIQSQANNFNFSNYPWPVTSSAGLQLSIPIFAGFKTDAKVQQAKLAKQQSETQLDNLKELIRAEVKTNLSNLVAAKKQIEVQRQTVANAERSYAITKNRRSEGIGSQLDVTDADLALSQSKPNYLQSIYDYLNAKVDLDKSLGRLAR